MHFGACPAPALEHHQLRLAPGRNPRGQLTSGQKALALTSLQHISFGHPCTLFSLPSQNRSRSSRFRILPVPPFGSGSETKIHFLGILNFASCGCRNSTTASSLSTAPSRKR